MRLLLVDDEPLARALLREQLAALPDVEIVGEAGNGFDAVRLAEELRPDLLLLDIQMPKLDGFEVVALLDPCPAVVFVTAHDEHAVRGFEVHAVDYLLKPVEPERLARAVARARERLAGGAPVGPDGGLLAAAARPPGTFLERVLVREEGRIRIVPVERIDFIEARDDYLLFHAGPDKHRKQQTLGELERQLDPRRFVRVHRSFLVALDRIVALDLYARDSWVARLADGTRLPVSRSGHDRLREVL